MAPNHSTPLTGIALLTTALAGCSSSEQDATRAPNPMVDPYINAARHVHELLASGEADSMVTHNGLTYQAVTPRDNEFLRVRVSGFDEDHTPDNNNIKVAYWGITPTNAFYTVFQEEAPMTPETFDFSKTYHLKSLREGVKGACLHDLLLFNPEGPRPQDLALKVFREINDYKDVNIPKETLAYVAGVAALRKPSD